VSLGHAAFMAIGAYTCAILTTRFHWSPWTAMLAAAAVVSVVAGLIGVPTLKLHGHYLAMGTDAHRLELATNGNALAIAGAQFSDTGDYFAVITNTAGVVTSAANRQYRPAWRKKSRCVSRSASMCTCCPVRRTTTMCSTTPAR
jgi:ABC-type uncharacterized transport system permease subunit